MKRVGEKGGRARSRRETGRNASKRTAAARILMIFSRFFNQSKQIIELRQDVDALKHSVKKLDEEWSDYYDRFRRLLAKMAKRDERANDLLREEEPQPAGGDGARAPSLSARQREINERILARRNRGVVKEGGE